MSLRQPYTYKPLKSARARYIKAAAKKQWQTAWRANTETASMLRAIMGGKYTKTPTLHNEIESRKDAAKIAQLRTDERTSSPVSPAITNVAAMSNVSAM